MINLSDNLITNMIFSLLCQTNISLFIVQLFKLRWLVSIVTELYFCLVSLFNGISTLLRLFNAKAILLEEQ